MNITKQSRQFYSAAKPLHKIPDFHVMWGKGHPYRWRTLIRTYLPWFIIDFNIADKGKDCENVVGWHHWYNIDNKNGGCYNCKIKCPGQLWKNKK